MKKIFYCLLFVLTFVLLGCDGEIKLSIYTRDLSDVVNERENVLYSNVNIIVESLDDENDIEFLRRNLYGFSNEKFVQYNYSTSLSFDVKVPIIKEGTDIDYSNCLLILTGNPGNNKTDYTIQYNKYLISRIDNYFYNKHYQNVDLTKFKIFLEINNDERKPVTLETYSAYVNGKPYPFSHQEVLQERDRISMEISEIFIKYISTKDDDIYPIFSINYL